MVAASNTPMYTSQASSAMFRFRFRSRVVLSVLAVVLVLVNLYESLTALLPVTVLYPASDNHGNHHHAQWTSRQMTLEAQQQLLDYSLVAIQEGFDNEKKKQQLLEAERELNRTRHSILQTRRNLQEKERQLLDREEAIASINFCPDCLFDPSAKKRIKFTCKTRTDYLVRKYKISRAVAINGTLQEQPINCRQKTTPSTSTADDEEKDDKPNNNDGRDDHVAACVMVMDGNHELIEWLAYHYHTLPLRRLILLNDPYSRTTPEPIIRRWRGKMEISLWNETMVFPRGAPNRPEKRRRLQKTFGAKCLHQLYKEGRHRWVQLFDPDEYATINERIYDENDPMYGLAGKQDQGLEPIVVPTKREANSTLTFVKRAIAHVHKFGTHNNKYLTPFETPCIGYKRKQYQPYQDDEEEQQNPENAANTTIDNDLLPGAIVQKLSTYRWRHWEVNGQIGKAMLDFDRIEERDIWGEASVHVPIYSRYICRRSVAWNKEEEMVLIMNHYARSLDQALFNSGDSRGGLAYKYERYQKERKSRRTHEPNPKILEWLPGFIDSVGKEEAERLLQYAGRPYMASVGAYFDKTKEVSEEEGMKLQQQLIAEAMAGKEAEPSSKKVTAIEEKHQSTHAEATEDKNPKNAGAKEQDAAESTTKAKVSLTKSPSPPSSLTTNVEEEDTDIFNPDLSMEDYYNLYQKQHHTSASAPAGTVPSKEWLSSCAKSLSNDTDIQKPFKVLRPFYRLGDCIKLCESCVDPKMWIRAKRSGNFSSNMAVMYKHLACGEGDVKGPHYIGSLKNFTVLDEVFEEFGSRPGFDKPDPDVLVVHLRLGDVIDNTPLSVEQFLIEGGIGAHPESRVNGIKSIHSIYKYLDILHELNNDDYDNNKSTMTPTKKIHIVGGSHKDFKYQKSKVYAHCLQRGLAKAGYEVEMSIEGRDPDQDFYFMSHAKKFMVSAGGFSRMIGHMVERKGGQLIGSVNMTNLKYTGKPTAPV